MKAQDRINYLTRMFVDYDLISDRDWNAKYRGEYEIMEAKYRNDTGSPIARFNDVIRNEMRHALLAQECGK